MRSAGERARMHRFVRPIASNRLCGWPAAWATRAAAASVCLVLGLALLLAIPAKSTAAMAPCANAALEPNSADEAVVADATLCLVNRVRAVHHLRLLHPNGHLAGAAERKVALMIADNYFADLGPQGQSPLALILSSGYVRPGRPLAFGQNLAWGSGSLDTPASIVAAWMQSPPHRAIILDPAYSDAGAAVAPSVPPAADGGAPGGTYAMEFALR
jgi:uncharacterized protein YkwD